jgi:DNA-binding NarL/FixJ family response regulator
VGQVALLGDVFSDLADGEVQRARARCVPQPGAISHALLALIAFWSPTGASDISSHAAAAHTAASSDAPDPVARAAALAASAFARAIDEHWDADPFAEALALLADHADTGQVWAALRYLVAESALANARLDDATAALRGGADPATVWAGHRFAAVMSICAIRAVECFVLGNSAAEEAPTLIAGAPQFAHVRRDFLARGALLMRAYGALGHEDLNTAATLVLAAGSSYDLGNLTVIDRAIGWEILVNAALCQGDLGAAQSWALYLDDLVDHPIGRPPATRALSRIALATGDVERAITLAEASLEAAQADGRGVEAAEAEIVLARARIAAGDVAAAGRRLRHATILADAAGHHAFRRSATVTLSSARRRLQPVVGAGWAALSPAETAVARRLLDGEEIPDIAHALVVSPHTVKIHVSRVLCAFAVASRIGLIAAVRPQPERSVPVAALTPRQQEVAALVAAGASNRQIGEALTVSPKTVEKHIADICRRWQTPSRFALARTWWSSDYARTPLTPAPHRS